MNSARCDDSYNLELRMFVQPSSISCKDGFCILIRGCDNHDVYSSLFGHLFKEFVSDYSTDRFAKIVELSSMLIPEGENEIPKDLRDIIQNCAIDVMNNNCE